MKTYSLPDLKEAWGVFEKKHVLRVLVRGKWETLPLSSTKKPIEGTQATMKKISDVMSFPEYLETLWQK